MTAEEFYQNCRKNGLEWAKQTLKKWVSDGQPESFCSGATSRSMCMIASNAITGKEDGYIDSKYGVDLYSYMWRPDIKSP